MSLQWFKIYGAEYLSDPKIKALSPQERSCWITILCLASLSTKLGTIEFLTVESLLEASGIKWNPYDTDEYDAATTVLSKLERMKMIHCSKEGIVTVLNWNKRQEHNLSVAERVAKHRQKQKSVTTHVTNVTPDKIRLDKIKIKDTELPAKLELPFSLKEEIQKLEENPRRDLNIIGLYFKRRLPDIKTKEQYAIALKRHLKPAKDLIPFTNDQLIDAIDYAQREYKSIYTLETLIKILTK